MRIITKSPFPKSTYKKNAEVYSVLANPKRLEILNLLKRENMSLENLVDNIGSSKANVSQHLSVLRHAGLVESKRRGREAYYSIVDPRIIEPCVILHKMRAKNKNNLNI